MKIRALAFAAIVLTAACSPDSGLGPTDNGSGGTVTVTSDSTAKRNQETPDASCSINDSKRNCDADRWNGSTGKR